MKKLITLLIAVFLLATSCEKEDEYETVQRLTKVSYKINYDYKETHDVKEYDLLRFYYNQDGLLTAYEYNYSEDIADHYNILWRVNVHYNSDNTIKSLQYMDIDTTAWYDGWEKTIKMDGRLYDAYYDYNNDFIIFNTDEPENASLTFDDKGNLKERRYNHYTFMYDYGANNNISIYRKYSQGGLHETTSLEYGSGNNPFYQFAPYDGLFRRYNVHNIHTTYTVNNPNNITKIKSTNEVHNWDYEYEYSYKFDNNNYPITRTRIVEESNGVVSTYTTKYEYKTITKLL